MLDVKVLPRLFSIALAWVGFFCGNVASAPGNCPSSHHYLLFASDPLVQTKVFSGFPDSLYNLLLGPLDQLGYCLRNEILSTVSDSAAYSETMVLYVTVDTLPPNPATPQVILTLMHLSDWNQGGRNVTRPLATLGYPGTETGPWLDLLTQKVVENMRRQSMAHIVLQTRPVGALVRSSSGLEGKAPLEWILPLGAVEMTATAPGYLPFQQSLNLARPGIHNLEFDLTKRRFYHSKLMIPTLAFAVLSATGYALENFFYDRYLRLGPEAQRTDPGAFARTFNTAQDFERAAGVSLAVSLSCLGLSFWY